MTFRTPVVLGGDGLPQQVQSGDGIGTSGAEWTGAIPSAPLAGAVREGVRTFGGRDLLSARSAQWPETPLQPLLGRDRVAGYVARPGIATLDLLPGTNTITPLGTATSRSAATTNLLNRTARLAYVSATTAAATAGVYNAIASGRFLALGDGAGNGGFHFIARFGVSDAATVSGAQMFVGVSNANSAPVGVDSYTQSIGVGQISTSNNLQILYGGSSAQVPIDLGANFPANTLGVDFYEVHIFSSPFDNTKVGYQVDRNGGSLVSGGFTASGFITNTTPGTTLPSTSTFMMLRSYRTNNLTALAVGLDISSMIVHTAY